MRIASVQLRNFRNILEAQIDPDPAINLVLGSNAQGKTSFLEAIGYVATLASFRGARPSEIPTWDEPLSRVSCALHRPSSAGEDWRTELAVEFARRPPGESISRTASIDGRTYGSALQYLGERFRPGGMGFHAITFNPSDHQIVRGDPRVRREYLNRVVSAEDFEYLKVLKRFQRVLEQRNSALKSNPFVGLEALEAFTEEFIQTAVFITERRLQWLEKLAAKINSVLSRIAPTQRDLGVVYLGDWVPGKANIPFYNGNLYHTHFSGQGVVPSLQDLEREFRKKLSLRREVERRFGTTLLGPHRDDWAFLIDGKPLKGFGSQGEVRSALLALKLSEILLFEGSIGVKPVLLLDDLSSELDCERRRFLMRFISAMELQVFITSTEDLPFDGRRFQAREGRLERPAP